VRKLHALSFFGSYSNERDPRTRAAACGVHADQQEAALPFEGTIVRCNIMTDYTNPGLFFSPCEAKVCTIDVFEYYVVLPSTISQHDGTLCWARTMNDDDDDAKDAAVYCCRALIAARVKLALSSESVMISQRQDVGTRAVIHVIEIFPTKTYQPIHARARPCPPAAWRIAKVRGRRRPDEPRTLYHGRVQARVHHLFRRD
jgi:hypothetical protein